MLMLSCMHMLQFNRPLLVFKFAAEYMFSHELGMNDFVVTIVIILRVF